ncbi:MAG: FAD-dependent oxidoreductase [Achromobacter sp.]|uniref:3-(3-hydroxy-phenyl)propionate/3-hydroxycinnamic acid hydroxylase n=1 Tax=Achromobacter insuavis TaxID=1287735 RepID=A0A6J4ZJZ6_9BURK|nr:MULTISPECIES: FAD-dependent oxidoreductase [Achromobacter]MBN9639127.1 FAD-dependent oxidoreductase [Achromobacter sp.]CAB3632748.1 3-(3-hydroxy-phenyl)propionate/3-hydroxycinnamic acid hydroxylase [Achromobacter insuavis]CUI33768.1 3-(3-hydroxy-phenyl)propionate/3-hydroxycinnamic acid hydroxylase [Achromobacter sp. 2789STDY5608628]CUI53186.1 3-(3-hydroxy-phenyl)propionate/3-hydroxycinnamic acid hydroxylase [Achromobacter sp. 2789STDY5608633]
MGDIDFQAMEFAYEKHADQAAATQARHPVVVVGAGPVGLTTALDLARQGVRVVVLDDDYRLSTGSRAICFSKRTLEIWDRLGVGQRMVDKGVSWNVGKVFFRDQEVWRFDLLPEPGHRRPAFINLQQYYAEGYLYEQARQEPNIDLRWKNKVVGLEQAGDGVVLSIDTPEGGYALRADWLVACDGARSPVRKLIGQESHGRIFRDRFLIADVKMKADFPAERWFWFDPPFHPNQSVLLHMQPDNVWRIDFQLGWNADPVEAVKPENVLPRIRALLGPDAQFDLEWVSVYTFACERMDKFRHGRVVFAGDSAHRVSPFGARGANSGVQDAENLAWKLRLVLAGQAPESLIDSYAAEREHAADENILNSSRATDFITPKSDISRSFRNAVLNLARTHAFARTLVNSGRLSLPATYADSPLNSPDRDTFAGRMRPGAVALDAPVRGPGDSPWWLSQLDAGFTLALFCGDQPPAIDTLQALRALRLAAVPVKAVLVAGPGCDTAGWPEDMAHVVDNEGLLAQRYDALSGTAYLIRPDQHIAARWRAFQPDAVTSAVNRAIGRA